MPTSRLTHTRTRVSEQAPQEKLSFTSLAIERLLIFFLLFLPVSSSHSDRLTVSASSSLFAFSIALTPLLLSTALLTSKWGDPFWRRLLKPDSLLGAACCSQLDSVRPSIPTGTAHYRVRSKSVRRLFLFFSLLPSARATHTLCP